ncbi:MAG TPA: bifunctional metallophosphatase/5'-nucleotidase [Lachnospiraceae bacterium]|uniref:bifunctional metallophosphatase/5'-nucleotidase n=1 Tax=Anaerosporobacter sp. TaxID=1872529 RepID=UPI000EC280FC|nr:bifunctional UDP-sugar hydrolase/5'-nucleotidase [Anaerosporobacter sp.]HAB59644.1 bifunctional metallophosphatase/5'-nucleotidase [Lachnospiraceae bacterium]
MKQLKIYFTSDVHGYVYPTDYLDDSMKAIGLLNCINHYQKDGNTLIIDGGDTIQGSPFTNYLSSKVGEKHPMADIMNAAGYDYVTLGNHEFNYGYEYLKSYLNHLDGKCLCTNIKDTTGGIKTLPYDIKVMENGLKVGVIGFTTDYITRWERPSNIENFLIEDVYASIERVFKTVKQQVDIVIGIYHGGFEYDLATDQKLSDSKENIAYKICKEFDFDLLLTGHQHMPIAGQDLHGTYIAQTPHNGTRYIELTMNYNKVSGEKSFESALNEANLPPNKEIYNKFLPLEEEVQRWLDTPVGHLSKELNPDSHLTMALHGSPLANFINQIQLEVSGADIACTSFANVIKGFNENVTVRDILATYPYPNTLVVLRVTKDILKKALERCASYFDYKDGDISISASFLKPKVEHYNYDYFSNLEYTFDLKKDIGNRVTSMRFHGKEITNEETLSLVMNNYRASGAGGYEFYSNCKVEKEILTEMPEIIINYFTKHSFVNVDEHTYIQVIHS